MIPAVLSWDQLTRYSIIFGWVNDVVGMVASFNQVAMPPFDLKILLIESYRIPRKGQEIKALLLSINRNKYPEGRG